jgi:hypothetical protein
VQDEKPADLARLQMIYRLITAKQARHRDPARLKLLPKRHWRMLGSLAIDNRAKPIDLWPVYCVVS